MITIRAYKEGESRRVGILIADTFRQFNLAYATPDEQEMLLGPFREARSRDSGAQEAIAQVIQAPVVLVADHEGNIVGVLRGSPGRLHSLFVAASHQGRGIGRRLVQQFEEACLQEGSTKITLASSLYAVPFYLALGYRKSTGVRTGRCFDGQGFPFQPMRKQLTTGQSGPTGSSPVALRGVS